MNKQCKFCIHSDVCAYKEHYKDAVALYEKAKNECGKYPYFVCDIRCVKYCKAEKEPRMAEKRTYDAEFFDGKCPYTDKPCNEWECDICEIEVEEKKSMEELDRAESEGKGWKDINL